MLMPHGLHTNREIGLAPRVLAALIAREFRLAARPALLARPVRGFQIKPPTRGGKLVVDLLEGAAWDEVMRHALAGFPPARHTGR